MLTGWSRHQVSDDPIQPSKYMLDAAVEKDFADGRGLEVRTPVPELLIGHPAVFQSALKIPKSALRYRVATLSFATEDIDVAKFNTGDVQSRQAISVTVDLFLEMAFAGIPPDHRPPVLVGTHTHTGRLEINFGIPRYVINSSGKVRSFNPHPPMKGSEIYWDAFGDFLNERFGWANPRAAEQASQIKGPDWAEKRVAAADRFGQKFDPENNPRLFLLQSAKEHARHHQARNPALFWEAFWGAVRSTEYRSTPDENGRLWLTSPRGDPLLLKGGLINSQENCSGRSEKLEVKHDISSLWQRRADQNSAAFSTGAWCEPPPIWAAYSKFSLMELPTHHPDFDPPTPNDGVLHFVSLTARFSAALRAVRSILTRKVAGLMVRRGLASLQPNFFMAIRQKLENLENEYPCNTTDKNDEPDYRALRPAAQGIGERGRDRHRRTDRRDDGGSQRNQRADGALYESGGGFGSGNRYNDVDERDAARDEGATLGAGSGYQVAPSAAEPAGLSRVRFLAALRMASDVVFPQDAVNIGMLVDGSFRISSRRGSILISGEGMVVGSQRIEVGEVTAFVTALSEFAICHLSLPEDLDTPDFF
jgi:hypothetical protein